MRRRSWLVLTILAGLLNVAAAPFDLGYITLRTNLPGGRQKNFETSRAHVARGDGSGVTLLVPHLVSERHASSQIVGWSPDGNRAVIDRLLNTTENQAWEEENQTFRISGWSVDNYVLDFRNCVATNLTAVDRISNYNTTAFFWPKKPGQMGFQAQIGDIADVYRMDADGRNKKSLGNGVHAYAYYLTVAPDGERIAFHRGYEIIVADADGSNPVKVETGKNFNFSPEWSPDGKQIVFGVGEGDTMDIYVANRDGSGARKLTDRGGHSGTIQLLEVPNFHGGGSDLPVWGADGWIYYSGKVGENVELFKINPATDEKRQLTHSTGRGIQNYFPSVSPDGKWVAFGSNRTGVRQLHAARTDGSGVYQVTRLSSGSAAVHAKWRPRSTVDVTRCRSFTSR